MLPSTVGGSPTPAAARKSSPTTRPPSPAGGVPQSDRHEYLSQRWPHHVSATAGTTFQRRASVGSGRQQRVSGGQTTSALVSVSSHAAVHDSRRVSHKSAFAFVSSRVQCSGVHEPRVLVTFTFTYTYITCAGQHHDQAQPPTPFHFFSSDVTDLHLRIFTNDNIVTLLLF